MTVTTPGSAASQPTEPGAHHSADPAGASSDPTAVAQAGPAAARGAVEAVWRIESARLIAGLARIVRDVGLAEDLAQDALVVALEKWPQTGVPPNPGAWLMTTAKRRGIDQLRRSTALEHKQEEIARDLAARLAEEPELGVGVDRVEDDLLRLIFTACHPVLRTEARVALTLRLLGGLTTPEIARAYLVPTATIAQRIVRAKRTLTEAQVPIEVPAGAELAPRLSSVLEVIYLIFNEGYAATAGDDLLRPTLCEEALRLGRILAALAPYEPEVHGLVALLELQASRTAARVDPSGAPVLLLEQDRRRWDRLLIRRGLAALGRAQALTAAYAAPSSTTAASSTPGVVVPARTATAGRTLGPYALQAAIAACHARARTAEDTDWQRIAALYEALAQTVPSPVIELNRAMAVAMADGPAAGLPIVDALVGERTLERYHLLPAARGDLLARLGRNAEASAELVRAAALTANSRERATLLQRAATLAAAEPQHPPPHLTQ